MKKTDREVCDPTVLLGRLGNDTCRDPLERFIILFNIETDAPFWRASDLKIALVLLGLSRADSELKMAPRTSLISISVKSSHAKSSGSSELRAL